MKKRSIALIATAVIAVILVTAVLAVAAGASDTQATGLLISPAPGAGAESEIAPGAQAAEADSSGTKAIAAAIVVGIASTAGAIAMGLAIGKSTESMARQPEASGKINSAMMLGLVFIETAIIYALIVAILIIFVL